MLSTDWHIHTCHSCDCRQGPVPATMAETVAAVDSCGLLDYGLSDHLHTAYNLPDLEASRSAFLELPPSPRRHVGAEVSVVSTWELAQIAAGRADDPVYGLREGGPPGAEPALGLTEEDRRRLGIEYVIGGAHWPLYVPLDREAIARDYHRQNLFLACHPLVTIVAHPWWWMGHWRDEDGMYRTGPWLDDFACVPQSMHEEFAAAAREHGKLVEANLSAMVLNRTYPERFRLQYCEYLAFLQASGVQLSLGSDHHAQSKRYTDLDFARGEAMLAAVGLADSSFWRLAPVGDGPQGGPP